jgi:hypothetical protein
MRQQDLFPRTFALTLAVAPDRDATRSLRAFLKIAGRHFGLRATSIRETTDTRQPRRSAARRKLSSAIRGDAKMDMRQFSGSSFYKVADVKKNGPVQEKIAGVAVGKFDKPDLVFESGSKLSLNATNTKTLIRAYGTDSEDWIDQTVELFEGEIEYQGKMQEAVLLRAISTLDPGVVKKKKKAKPDPMDDEVAF